MHSVFKVAQIALIVTFILGGTIACSQPPTIEEAKSVIQEQLLISHPLYKRCATFRIVNMQILEYNEEKKCWPVKFDIHCTTKKGINWPTDKGQWNITKKAGKWVFGTGQ